MRIEHDLAFPVLSDPQLDVIRAYGLDHAKGGLHDADVAVPAHVLVDSDGRIAWRRVSSKIQDRPDPLDVLMQIARVR